MKKLSLIVIIGLFALNMQAQLVLTTTGMGTVGVEYGTDYSLWDPSGAEDIYLYLWIYPDQTDPELPFEYNDDWNDATSLVVINWSATDNKFVGEIDFNTHDFLGEGVLPGGTGIDNFNLILRNEAGSSQSDNQFASDHGFGGTQTASIYDFQADKASYYSNGKLFLNSLRTNELIEITIFDSAGKQIFAKQLAADESSLQVDVSHLPKTVAVLKVQTATDTYFTKKIAL